MRKIAPLVLTVACLILLTGCSRRQPILVGSQSDGITKGEVLISHMSFIPHKITITAGETVTWVWDDGPTPHNVTFTTPGLSLASPNQAVGSFRHTFDTPGTYHYICTIHNNMSGIVVVEPATS